MPKMCSAYKDIRRADPDRYIQMIGDGKYLCKKCGRTACDKKYLCCSMEIKPGEPVSQQELNYCELGSCSENKVKKIKKKKLKKMSEDDIRRLIREEVYATIKRVLEEVKE